MIYLMLEDEAAKIEAALEKVTPEACEKAAAAPSAARQMTIATGEARISVSGALLPMRSALLDYFGIQHTGYDEVKNQIRDANSDKSITAIRLNIDSPGGTIDGMYSAMEAIAGSGKKVSATVTGTAASAAYMLASQASSITAENPLNLVGSVGVVAGYYLGSDRFKEITNSDSPKKRPDVNSPDGMAAVKSELDDIFGVIAEKVASGRGTDVETVKANYGQGSILTAKTALAAGMIDGIGAKPSSADKTADRRSDMDQEKEKAERAEELSAAVESGMKQERDRVVAHITLGQASGDMETAIEAIKSGDGITETIKAKHLGAEIKKRSIEARAAEAPGPLAVAAPVETEKSADSRDKIKTDLEAAHSGVTIEWRN